MVTSQMSQRHTDVTGAASDANVAAVAAPGAASKEAFIHFYWCEDPYVLAVKITNFTRSSSGASLRTGAAFGMNWRGAGGSYLRENGSRMRARPYFLTRIFSSAQAE
jgi:hypothetical protein